MKKYFKILMIMVLVVFPFVTVNAKTTKKAEKGPINFYIFYGSTCGYCQKLHNYTATLEKDKNSSSKKFFNSSAFLFLSHNSLSVSS